jgi:transposase InsO family protein
MPRCVDFDAKAVREHVSAAGPSVFDGESARSRPRIHCDHNSQMRPALRCVPSRDTTKLPGPTKGTYFTLYIILDIYSRYIVG